MLALFCESTLFRCWFVSCHVLYRLVIFMSRRCCCSLIRISLSCSSVIGICTRPACASCMSWSSSIDANSGLTILRLLIRCRAFGVSIRRSMACFCISTCCCACARCCSWASLCCSSFIRRLRSSSSWASSTSSSLIAYLHRSMGIFSVLGVSSQVLLGFRPRVCLECVCLLWLRSFLGFLQAVPVLLLGVVVLFF